MPLFVLIHSPSVGPATWSAVADRLTAVIFAASSVNLALNDFYNQLDDAQKTKFNNAVR